jgi:hypothetical protein
MRSFVQQLTNSSVCLTATGHVSMPKAGRVVAGMQCYLTLLVSVCVVAKSLVVPVPSASFTSFAVACGVLSQFTSEPVVV